MRLIIKYPTPTHRSQTYFLHIISTCVQVCLNECGSSSNLVLEIFGLLGVGPADDGHAAGHSERSHHAHIGDGGEGGLRRDGGRGSGENGHGGDHGESCHLVCNDLVLGCPEWNRLIASGGVGDREKLVRIWNGRLL